MLCPTELQARAFESSLFTRRESTAVGATVPENVPVSFRAERGAPPSESGPTAPSYAGPPPCLLYCPLSHAVVPDTLRSGVRQRARVHAGADATRGVGGGPAGR